MRQLSTLAQINSASSLDGTRYYAFYIPDLTTFPYLILRRAVSGGYSYHTCINDVLYEQDWQQHESLSYVIQAPSGIDFTPVLLRDALVDYLDKNTLLNENIVENQTRQIALQTTVAAASTTTASSLLTNQQMRAAPIEVSVVSRTGQNHVVVDNQPVSYPVTGTFWPSSQPVTIAGSQHVTIDNQPSSYPVTGSFWQATQPVSGPVTDAQLRATPLPVAVTFPGVQHVSVDNFPASFQVSFASAQHVLLDNASLAVTGNFYPPTQPVSLASNTPDVTDRASRLLGHVTVDNPVTSLAISNLPATQKVDGSGVTQPVSLAVNTPDITDRAARQLGHVSVDNLPAVQAVSGTFFQATQPVSGTISVNNFPATYPVTGTFWQATQPVSALSLPLPTGAGTAANQASILSALGLLATAAKQDAATTLLQSILVNTGGLVCTPFTLVTANGNNATTLRAGATWLLNGSVTNTATSIRYFFLYNLASVPATLPTTTAAGLVRTIGVGPGQTFYLELPGGRYTAFSNGLTIAAATASTLSTVTSTVAGIGGSLGLTAGDLVINLDYSA